MKEGGKNDVLLSKLEHETPLLVDHVLVHPLFFSTFSLSLFFQQQPLHLPHPPGARMLNSFVPWSHRYIDNGHQGTCPRVADRHNLFREMMDYPAQCYVIGSSFKSKQVWLK